MNYARLLHVLTLQLSRLLLFHPVKNPAFFFFFLNKKKMPKSCLHPSRMSQDNKPVFLSPPFINETRWFLPEEVFTHPLPNTAFLCVCSHLTVFVWQKADGPQRWDLLFQCKICGINSSGMNLFERVRGSQFYAIRHRFNHVKQFFPSERDDSKYLVGKSL